MSDTKIPRFVWRELMSTDAKRAVAYYTELLNWGTQPMDMGAMGTYTVITAQGKGIGGIMQADASKGLPTHWMTVIGVTDIDRVVAEAPKHGGKVVMPATPIPNVGRYANLQDPTGALFSVLQGNEPMGADEGMPPTGAFCWDELLTPDPAAAAKFYTGLFGWTAQETNMAHGAYTLLKRGERDAGGLMKSPPNAPPHAHWLSHVAVESADASAERAKALGGKVVQGPFDIPNYGRAAVIVDPTGGALGLFQPKKG